MNPLGRLLPRETGRGRAARRLAAGLSLIPDETRTRDLARYARQVEPGLFAPPLTVAPDPGEPWFSLVIPCFNTADRYLEPLIDCLLAQSFGAWEAVLADASTEPERRAALAAASRRDPRLIHLELTDNGGISANSNAALAVARGRHVVFVDHDDLLSPQALNELASRIAADPETDILYSDEDLVSDDGRTRRSPFFKPAWSPEMFLEVNYTNHLSAIRRHLVEAVGGLRPEFDGAQDYDLLLRLHSLPGDRLAAVNQGRRQLKVAHVPKILYHWRQTRTSTARRFAAKPYALEAGRRALTEHLERLGLATAGVEGVTGRPGWYNPRPRLSGLAQVVVLPPETSAKPLDDDPAEAIRRHTDCQFVQPEFIALPHRRALADWRPAAEAVAVALVRGDQRPADPHWLDELAGVLALPGVALVGPLLTRADGRVVSAGLLRHDGQLVSPGRGRPHTGGTAMGPVDTVRDVDALSAAVVVTRPDDLGLVGRWLTEPPSDGRRAVMWGHQRFVQRPLPAADGWLNPNFDCFGRHPGRF